MNDLCNHEASALAELENKTAWLALVDHHQEVLDVSRRVALRAVGAMRRKARREAELSKACKLVADGARFRENILETVRAFCCWSEADHAPVYVLPGRMRPSFVEASNENGQRVPQCDAVLVGARYVLKLFDVMKRVMELENEANCDLASYMFFS